MSLISSQPLVIGIDPGIGRVGFALLRGESLLSYGLITTDKGLVHEMRLCELMNDMEELLRECKPELAVIEELVFVQNITTGMKVSEARGVILACCAKHGVPVLGVSSKEAKKQLTGNGGATKSDVQRAAQRIYKLEKPPTPDDTADAIAIGSYGTVHSRIRSVI